MRSLSARFVLFPALAAFALLTARSEVMAPAETVLLFPQQNAVGICTDTPLRITCRSAPKLSGHGLIKLVEASTDTVVETIDTSQPFGIKAIGGQENYHYYPVLVMGDDVCIYPQNHLLDYGKSYYVIVEAGVFSTTEGESPAWEKNAWCFTTRNTSPAKGLREINVAADGTGDFCTVQGAIDFIPSGNTQPTTILLKSGTYTEMVYLANKHGITIRGEDRKKSILAYATNAKFNNTPGTYRRGVFIAFQVDDLTLSNLTIRNTTPQGGSQAEAIILNGSPHSRAALTNVDLYSYQDTLQINGQAYIKDSTIEGDVDFMWGTGPCFFENCICYSVRSNAYYTQVRNPPTNHGYVFLRCVFNGAPGVTGNYLSRIAPARFPASEVVLVDCVLTSAVGPVAWQLQGDVTSSSSAALHFFEYHSHDPAGHPTPVDQRLAVSRQLQPPDDEDLIHNYSDAVFVLGDGWNPKAPSQSSK